MICCALLQNDALLNSKTKLWSLSQSECIKKPPTPTHVDQTIRMKYTWRIQQNIQIHIIETQRVGASTVKQHYTAVRFLLLATTGKKIKMCWRLDWIQRRPDLIQTTWNQTQCLSKYMQTCSLRGLFKKKKIVCQQTVVKSKHSSCALTLLHGLTFSFLRANSSPGFKLALRPFFPSLLLRFLQIHRLHIQ